MSRPGQKDVRKNAPAGSAVGFLGAPFSSLKFRIVAFTLSILVVTIWILATQAALALRKDMEHSLSEQQYTAVASLADSIGDSLKTRVAALQAVAGGINPRMLEDGARLRQYLGERRAIYRLFGGGIWVISAGGRVLLDHPAVGRAGQDLSGTDYFGEIRAGAARALGKPQPGRAGLGPETVFAVPIHDAAGHVVGVLAGGCLLANKEMLARVDEAIQGERSQAFVVSVRDKLLVGSSRPEWLLQPVATAGMEKMIDPLLAGRDGSGVATDSEGKARLVSGKHIPDSDWLLVVAMPVEEAFASIDALEMRMYGTAGLLALFFGMLMWFFVRRQLRPLEESVAIIRHMSLGTFDLQAMPLHGTREIQELQSSFNQLQERIVAQQKIISRESARNALFLSAASDGVHILDENGNLVEASTAFCDMLGYGHDEMMGMNVACWDMQWSREHLQHNLAQPLLAPAVYQTRHRRRDGSTFDVEVHSTPFELDGRRLLYASSRDITERKVAEARIHQLAFFDPLTSLPNRRLLLDRLTQALAGSRRSGQHGALLFLDLDRFKILNDTQGHDVGDHLLLQVAGRLRASVRESDTVARLGGDEFVVILENLDRDKALAASQAEAVAEKIRVALDQPYTLGKYVHRSSASIGVSLFPDEDANGDVILKRADIALYQAKEAGRNDIRFYSPAMQSAQTARIDLENGLRRALVQDELHLYYQPQFDRQGHIIGAEALLRWQDPERGLLLPAEFLPLAEESGLILPIGRLVLRTACAQLAEWLRAGHGELQLAVNVSARQFLQPEFVDQVRLDLAASGADPSRLRLELAGSLVFDKFGEVVGQMQALRAIGVGLVLDNFGRGHFSLADLKRLPLAQLKIDRDLVRDLSSDLDNTEAVQAILAIGRTLGLPVVAVGIENNGQQALLEAHGCDAFQGYLFSRALPADEFGAQLATAG